MAVEETKAQKIVRIAKDPKHIRNIATSAHIHHGKTAFTDNLLAAAGFMSTQSAGDLEKGMATWGHSDEQERLMTVDSANVSMVHDFNNEQYLINLIDTPGHVDFGGNVTRAMRAVDGTIVLVCASEGIMPQTETVLKQALKERVKPVLFINKVDRLINELKLTPEQMQERFMKIYADFNRLIEEIAEPQFKQAWKVDIMNGSVAFGSARDNFGISIPFMKKKNISFKDIFNMYKMEEKERQEWVWKNAPLFEVILDMVIRHLPNPIDAQNYRIPRMWGGDLQSEMGKDLMTCNPNGKLAFVITRIVIDPISGKEMSAGRLFSGTMRSGTEVWLNLAKASQKVTQVVIYNGVKPEYTSELPAGNIIAITGVTGNAGETITLSPEEPFIELKHMFEPVITKAIEAKKMADLPKLVEVLRKVAKEDPSIRIEIDEETGQNLMSGMGELHLEIIEDRIRTEKNVEVITSPPIVVFRETVMKKSPEVEGKTPNKHNIFFMTIEPLEDAVYEAYKRGDLRDARMKKQELDLWKSLTALGVDYNEAKQYKDIYKSCVFIDKTKGIVQIQEVMGLVLDAFEQVIDQGPLIREPVMKLKVCLVDAKLHEDAIHRGPAQIYPAIREGLKDGMNKATPVIYEPQQIHLIECPINFIGEITTLITSKRGQVLEVNQEGNNAAIKAKIPVGEMLGWSSELRSATEGRGVSSLMDQMFERAPVEVQNKIIRQVRERKGMKD